MKGKNLREAQEDYKEKVVGLCCVCEKPTAGWYGRWGNGGSCSKKCEQVQEAKPKYPTTEELQARKAESFGDSTYGEYNGSADS